MKRLLVLLIVGILIFAFCGCTPSTEDTSDQTSEEATEETTTSDTTETADTEDVPLATMDLAFVMPGTDSQYWNQYIGTGVYNAVYDIEEQYGCEVTVEEYGPAQEGATDEYMSILESVIAKQPDAIVTGTMQPDGTAPLIKTAAEKGIFVNLFSLGITGEEDSYGTLYYCDQPEQGVIAADAMVEQLNRKGLPLEGICGVHMATLVPILEEKLAQFAGRMGELAPDIEVLETVYNENDINKSTANAENQIATYGDDLIALFGGNNLSGDGICLAVEKADIQDRIATVAVDSDDIEIQALKNGFLDAIVVQTPYEQGYRSTMNAFEYLAFGTLDDNEVNIPAKVVTQANMEETEYAALLNPLLLKKE